MLSAEIAPGGTTGRHTHPGDEYTYVLQGTLELRAEGRETRVAVTLVIDKGKPIIEFLDD